jgi:hypothetical protein
MPNQMIALQSRGAKMLDPTAQTAKFVNMMNMTKQQEAAERQASLAQQSMDINLAEEGRAKELHGPALKKAQLEYVGLVADQFSRDVAKLKDGDIAGAEALRANIVKDIPAWNDYIRPASEWTTEYRTQLMLKGKEIADKTIPDVVASKEYAGPGAKDAQGNPIPENTVIDTRIGGFSYAAGSTPLRAGGAATPAPRATPTAPQPAPAGPVPTGKFGETRVVDPESIPLTPYQQEHIREMQNGMGMSQPASFSPSANAAQMTPEVMSRIADSAFQTGVMAQVDFDQLLATQPPENRQAFTDAFRRAKITIQADAPSLADSGMGQQPMAANPVQRPQAGFADFRGPTPQSRTANLGGDMPMMRNTEAQYIPVQRRDVNVAPIPSPVPAAVLGAQEEAKTRASKNVELEMAPEIAKATKLAERAVELKSTATKAKYATEALLNELADRIDTVDRLLRNKNRFSIVGPIEGNLPRLMQYGARADAQAAFDKIKNTATLTSLVDLRKSTETNASPVGANPTDKDAKIVEQAASEFIQTGEPSKFDANLIDMRRKLYRTFQSAQREHEGVYADVLKDNPGLRLVVPKVSDRYLSTKDIPKPRTSTKVDQNNPLLKSLVGAKR